MSNNYVEEVRRKRQKRDLSKIFHVPFIPSTAELAGDFDGLAPGIQLYPHQRRALYRLQEIEDKIARNDLRLPGMYFMILFQFLLLYNKTLLIFIYYIHRYIQEHSSSWWCVM